MATLLFILFFFFQAEDGIRDLVRSRGLGDVYKRQLVISLMMILLFNMFNKPRTMPEKLNFTEFISQVAVSYTHLTLPTIYSV